jgi:hypothetical protein
MKANGFKENVKEQASKRFPMAVNLRESGNLMSLKERAG